MPLTTSTDGAHHPAGSRNWNHHRETIERLYVTDDRSLPEVVGMMSTLHGFVATERQYKRRISEWHLDKNVKDEEMRAIIATEALRLQQGKQSAFYVRDRLVDSKKIDRFAHRKKIDKYRSAALAKSSLPPDVRCITPPEDGRFSLQSMPSQPKSRAPKRKAPSHDLRDTISTEHREESQRRPEDLPTRTQEESTQGTAPTHTVSEKYPEKLHKPSTSECAKALSPALSDVYQDELYNPLLAAPARPQHALSSKMAVLHDRLQAAQRSHATLTPKSLDDESFVTAALIRQREKVESDFREFANHVPKPPSSPPPRTISPKEVALDYNETEEDADMPLFPQDNGGHESSLPSSTHRSQPYRPWTVLAGLSVEEYLLALAEGLQERLSNDNTLSIARSHLRLFRDDFCAKLLSLAMEKSTRIIQAGKSYINGESFCLRCSGCARFIKATTYLCSTCSDGYYNLCPTCQLGNGPRDPRGHLLTRLDHDFEATAPSVTDAWEYIVESFASKNDAINFMGVVHCWELILPWLKRGYMLSRPLINWSIARGSYLNLESDKAHGEAKDYSRAATDPLSHEILLSVSSKTGATPRSNLRQESETIDKDVENFDPFRYNMQTIMLGTASPGRPASPTKGFHLGAPPKQASLGSEQSNLRILSTVAHWEKMAEKDRQFSSGQLSEERSIQPFKTGSPYARDASTPTPVPRGNSPETTTQPSASSASSHAKVDDISRLIDDHQATLHDKKDPSNQQHQLSNLSPGTSRNSSTAPSEPSVDAASHQKNSSLRDRSQQIDLLDRSSPNHDPIPRDRASNPLSETPLIDWGLADRDLPARRSSEEPFFTTGRTPFFSKLRWDHERPKALDKENYYTSPIAIALSSLPASLRQRPIDMFYFRFFTDNTARLLVSHDCDSNPFRSVLPRMALRNEHLLGLLLAYSASHRARLLGYPRPVARVARWTSNVFPSLRRALESNTERISNDDLAISIMLISMTITCPDVFEVPIQWQHHLPIVKRLFKHRSTTLEEGSLPSLDDKQEWDFLSRWITYLAVIGSLNGFERDRNFQQFGVQDRQSASVVKSNEVDCLYGCTTELMEMLGAAAEYTNTHASGPYTCTSQSCAARFETAAELQQHRREGNCDSAATKPFARPASNESSERSGDKNVVNNGVYMSAESILGAKWLAIANYKFPYRHPSYEGRNPSNGALEGMEVNAVQKLFSQANMVYIYRRIEGRPKHDPSVQMHIQEIVDTVELVSAANRSQPGILFPLFIAGCEARTEAQRRIISNGFGAIEKLGMAQMTAARQLMERAWNIERPWWRLSNGVFLGHG